LFWGLSYLYDDQDEEYLQPREFSTRLLPLIFVP
jgi:hypothetical protein